MIRVPCQCKACQSCGRREDCPNNADQEDFLCETCRGKPEDEYTHCHARMRIEAALFQIGKGFNW